MKLKGFILNPGDDTDLIDFLEQTGNNTTSILGYHFPFYRDMLEVSGIGQPLYLCLRNEFNRIIAVLPGFIKKGVEGSVYSSMPFFGPNGGILTDSEYLDSKLIHQQLLAYLFEQLDQLNIISASIYSPFEQSAVIPFYSLPDRPVFVTDKFTSYIKLKDYKLKSNVEYDVRKAIKLGVTTRTFIRDETDIQNIYQIYKKNCIDYGIPSKPEECVTYLLRISSKEKRIGVHIAEIDNKIIGALIMIYGPSVASYYLPCSIHEYRSFQPVTLLISNAIFDSISRGIKVWNWESSPAKDSGVYKFKKKWGSEDGHYKIFTYPFRELSFFKTLGQNKITQLFPFFFVFPFNQIQND